MLLKIKIKEIEKSFGDFSSNYSLRERQSMFFYYDYKSREDIILDVAKRTNTNVNDIKKYYSHEIEDTHSKYMMDSIFKHLYEDVCRHIAIYKNSLKERNEIPLNNDNWYNTRFIQYLSDRISIIICPDLINKNEEYNLLIGLNNMEIKINKFNIKCEFVEYGFNDYIKFVISEIKNLIERTKLSFWNLQYYSPVKLTEKITNISNFLKIEDTYILDFLNLTKK